MSSTPTELDIGVDGGHALVDFADAVVTGTQTDINHARTRVEAELGRQAAVDAAAVIANFQRMVRIADSTGIPLDEPVLMMSQTIRKDLGINEYHAAQNTPKLSFPKRVLGTLLSPFVPKLAARVAGNMISQDPQQGTRSQ